MRVRVPFQGTLLKEYGPGFVPTFDPADPMYPFDDIIGPHGSRVLYDTIDYDEATVELEVMIDRLARVRLPDGSIVVSNEIPDSLPADAAVIVVGAQTDSEYAVWVADSEASITAAAVGKTQAQLRTASRRDGSFTDSRPQDERPSRPE